MSTVGKSKYVCCTEYWMLPPVWMLNNTYYTSLSLCLNRNTRASLDVLVLQYFSNHQWTKKYRDYSTFFFETRMERCLNWRGVLGVFRKNWSISSFRSTEFEKATREKKSKFKNAVHHFANILRFQLENSLCLQLRSSCNMLIRTLLTNFKYCNKHFRYLLYFRISTFLHIQSLPISV